MNKEWAVKKKRELDDFLQSLPEAVDAQRLLDRFGEEWLDSVLHSCPEGDGGVPPVPLLAQGAVVHFPPIPKLAQGAVLPANRPFLAVVGDQKHGTNVEAPLGVIQEAVALELTNLVQSNLAGHEATVAVLRQILEAVLGIEIGDEVIGRAVGRYNAAMAVMRGGRD